MDSGIIVLRDGTPCVFYDEELPHIKYIEFNRSDFLITLVWDHPESKEEERMKLEYPLGEDFATLITRYRFVAVCQVKEKDKAVEDLHMVPVKLINDEVEEEELTAGLVIMKNGAPALLHDGPMPHIKQVELNRTNAHITLIWDNKGTGAEERLTMPYPVPPDFLPVLEEYQGVTIAHMNEKENKFDNISVTPVVFTDSAG